MSRTTARVLAALVLASVALTTPVPAVAEPEVTPTVVDIPDPLRDFRLDKDLRENKRAVSAAKASEITDATFTIIGSGETGLLEARISVARLLGKKHAYNQAVGLYGLNFQYNVKSDGTVTFNTFRRKHASCAQTTHRRDKRAEVVTVTMPLPCLATGLDEQKIDARTWIHRRPKGYTVGGDNTQYAGVDLTTSTFTSVTSYPCHSTGDC